MAIESSITWMGAFAGGVLSFVSPCVLPLVPPYLAYMAGVSMDEMQAGAEDRAARRRVIWAAIAFVLGFSTVFVALGATASMIGQFVREWSLVLSYVAGVVIIIMGLHFLGLFRIGLFYREARFQVERKPAGPGGAYVMGLAFAFGWTPCIGPILAAILAVAGAQDTVATGAAMLGVYSLGLGLPFLLAAVFAGSALATMKRMRAHMGTVEKVMGGAMVLTGILFLTGQIERMSFWLLETFPALATIG
jgi:cytochrome c-type biogenesis protein